MIAIPSMWDSPSSAHSHSSPGWTCPQVSSCPTKKRKLNQQEARKAGLREEAEQVDTKSVNEVRHIRAMQPVLTYTMVEAHRVTETDNIETEDRNRQYRDRNRHIETEYVSSAAENNAACSHLHDGGSIRRMYLQRNSVRVGEGNQSAPLPFLETGVRERER
jgi:hypothetical protein